MAKMQSAIVVNYIPADASVQADIQASISGHLQSRTTGLVWLEFSGQFYISLQLKGSTDCQAVL